MDFYCEYCKYRTNNSGNYCTHSKTVKHQKNKEKIDAKNKLHNCKLCDGLFVAEIIIDHTLKCAENQTHANTVDKLYGENARLSEAVHKLEDKLNTENIKFNEIIHKLEEKINNLGSENKALNDELKKYLSGDKEYLKTLVDNAGKVVNNTVKYLNKNHPNAPVFKKMSNFSLLEKEKDLFGMVISKYMNKVTYKYLGDVIRNYYIRDNPNEQTVWVSDVARLTYELKVYMDENNNKSKWVKDKKGVTICEEAIIPLLEFVRDVLIRKINILKNGKEYELVRLANELVGLIDNGSLKDEINRYIAPFFQYKLGYDASKNLEYEMDNMSENKSEYEMDKSKNNKDNKSKTKIIKAKKKPKERQ
jgi:hypothetical protein